MRACELTWSVGSECLFSNSFPKKTGSEQAGIPSKMKRMLMFVVYVTKQVCRGLLEQGPE